jgi:hypothetical protein
MERLPVVQERPNLILGISHLLGDIFGPVVLNFGKLRIEHENRSAVSVLTGSPMVLPYNCRGVSFVLGYDLVIVELRR